MAPRLSGQNSIFGVVFFVSKSLLGIERQKKLEKFAILTRKPRSHARILIYRTWPIRELAVEDAPAFARYFRMDKEKFNDLVGRISIHIQRQDMTSPLRATGETFSSLKVSFVSAVRRFLK